ncbi:hypothetical protein GCM10007170_36630 [Arthrobacter liuii]|uniref:HTH cro/C1-type domain-containing protein n=2 Tax=Arthrobacter liuii TaxID=1476996 RepID=A0ABQ2AWM4_9MICC|nr:hypothetical protein GCM10007170_36630 [Arthrobacter liuii]
MAVPPDRPYFGKVARISWLEGRTETEKKRIATARLQHALAVKITGTLRGMRYNVRSYAKLAGVSYDRMAKVLRGEALMRLEDIADAERLLGLVIPALLEVNETRSPEQIAADQKIEAALKRREALNLMREAIAAELELAKAGEIEYNDKSNPSPPDPPSSTKPKAATKTATRARNPIT